MPAIPLAVDAYKRGDAFQPEILCVNFYLEEDRTGASPDKLLRLQRPGLTRYLQADAAIRGLFQQDGVMSGQVFAAWGDSLRTVTPGSFTTIGNIDTGSRVRFAPTLGNLYVLSSGVAYRYDGSTLSAVAMPDSRDVIDIESIDNYLILACPDGRFYWIEPGQTTVDPLNFATAESASDGLVAVRRLLDELWFFGRQTLEPWQPTKNDELPFIPAGGRTMERGCLARDTVHRFDNSLLWLGDDGVVYRAANVPQRISTHGIEQRLRERADEPSAMIVEHDGHKFYVLRIPGQGSFAYDAATQFWGEWQWEGSEPHVATSYPGGFLLGSVTSGKVFRLDPDVNTDDAQPMIRRLTGGIALMGRAGRNDSLSIGVGASADFTLKVRWADGQDGFPQFYEELDARAPMDVVNLYRLGMPEQPYRTFDILVEEDVKVRIAGAVANEGWQ